MSKLRIKNMALTGILIAMGLVLAQLAHLLPQGGWIFLPMHFTVLLCGLICGGGYGMICGLLTPLISSLFSPVGMETLIPRMLELATYGLVAGILFAIIRPNNRVVRIYTALIGAMLAGRIVYGGLNALIYKVGKYSLQIWITSTIIACIVGIIIQLVLIPTLILALEKAGVIDRFKVTV